MRNRAWWIASLIIALALTIVSPLASRLPDGLERVAEAQGFMHLARDSFYEIIPGYVLPGLHSQALANIVAGMIGVLIVFGLCFGVGYVLRVRRSDGETGKP
ncbi:MAG: hypothetical protein CEE40_00500 [Chloroflexi bacterium B3_Chlor]|nr:MAG: hypothetical protein CEE40_00500 [Chloroflexi bacterium B3_Chlor]